MAPTKVSGDKKVVVVKKAAPKAPATKTEAPKTEKKAPVAKKETPAKKTEAKTEQK